MTIHHDRPNAREHDAKVTTLIMRLRHDFQTSEIFRCKFLLLTRNAPFAQIAKKECRGLGRLRGDRVPPVVHRRTMSTAVWLRSGLGLNSDEIPKRMILASCEQVLALRENVIQSVKNFSTSLTKEKAEQLDLLLSRDRSSRMLMDKTLGVSKVITDDNIGVLWDEMISPYIEDERRKAGEALAIEKSKAKSKASELRGEIRKAGAREKQLEKRIDASQLSYRKLIFSIAEDVQRKIERERDLKIWGCVLAAVVVAGIPFMADNIYWVWGGFLLSAFLTYLTLIGGRLAVIEPSKVHAEEKFIIEVRRRGVEDALEHLDVVWTEGQFYISSKTQASSNRTRLL